MATNAQQKRWFKRLVEFAPRVIDKDDGNIAVPVYKLNVGWDLISENEVRRYLVVEHDFVNNEVVLHLAGNIKELRTLLRDLYLRHQLDPDSSWTISRVVDLETGKELNYEIVVRVYLRSD